MNNKTNKNKGLGRGLSSLIADVSGLADTEVSSDSIMADRSGYRSEPIINIFPNPEQPVELLVMKA